MSGGMAFVYDAARSFERRVNGDSVVWQRLTSRAWEAVLYDLIVAHRDATDSKWSTTLIDEWDRARDHFWQVVPREMLSRLPHPLDDAPEAVAAE